MRDPNALPLPELYRELARSGLIERAFELARDEDLGAGARIGDVTSESTIEPAARGEAAMVARAPGIIAGLEALPALARVYGGTIEVETRSRDGATVASAGTLAVLRGTLRDILTFERTALNLVGRLSGIATLTAEFRRAMGEGHRAGLYDTRKTTPGLRLLEKYAVRCGGGRCHRIGLFDAVLIKDNHLAGVALDRLGEFVSAAAARARAARPDLAFVEVEVDSLEQLEQILGLPAGTVDIVLLDNMGLPELRRAVQMRDQRGPRPELEASGGVRLDTVRELALTGVERISSGALTHSAVSLDIAIDMLPPPRGKAGA